METTDDKFEKGLASGDLESGSDNAKNQHIHVEGGDTNAPALTAAALGGRTFEAPEWIRNLSLEERHSIEANLKRKLDIRLMPMIVIMYIMNYLDRVSRNS
jgi:hypothetical protein